MSCPTNETLERLALDFLTDPRPAERHVDSCDACGRRLDALREEHRVLTGAARRLPRRIRRPMAFLWKPLAFAAVAHAMLFAGLFLVIQDDFVDSDDGNVLVVGVRDREARFQEIFRRDAYERRGLLKDDSTAIPTDEPSVFFPHVRMSDHNESADNEDYKSKNDSFLSYIKGDAGGGRGRQMGVGRAHGGRMGGRAGDEPARPVVDGSAGMTFKDHGTHDAIRTADQTMSTFGLDVDTASYTKIRDLILNGKIPPKEAVRVEECLNYFKYADPKPTKAPFSIRLEAAPSPFVEDRQLLRIAIQTREIRRQDRKNVNLTFIIDVSGSMAMDNRLGLVKRSLAVLVGQLRPADQVGIVVYGSTARTVLHPTPVSEGDRILQAIHSLHTEGSTNLEAGLNVGYDLAARCFDPKATNRVVLCTDGVANNGMIDPKVLVESVREKAAKGIWLSVFGFGMDNYNDDMMVTLATKGNGNYAFIDDLQEARKVFTQKLAGLFEVAAADAKVQVEFTPANVTSFRQIGYEKRSLRNEDFRNDKIDAGELGAGHHVTALYEMAIRQGAQGRLAAVRLRFTDPETKEVVEVEESIGRDQLRDSAQEASPSYQLAATVAQFAEILRDSPHARRTSLAQVAAQAHVVAADLGRPADVVEFVGLVTRAAQLLRR